MGMVCCHNCATASVRQCLFEAAWGAPCRRRRETVRRREAAWVAWGCMGRREAACNRGAARVAAASGCVLHPLNQEKSCVRVCVNMCSR